MEFQIGNHTIGANHPTYFIADIAANHDGDLERAKTAHPPGERSRRGCGQVPEFQRAQDRLGLRLQGHEGGQVSHQATWKKSVFEVYQDASIPFEWTPTLNEECNEVGIDYFSSPYDFEAIDMLDPVCASVQGRFR